MGRGTAARSSGPESATACMCCSWLSEAWDSEVSDAALSDTGASSWASAAGGPANIADGSSWASRSPSVSPPVSSAPTHAYCPPEPRNVSTLMVRRRAEGQGRPRKSTGYELDTLVGRHGRKNWRRTEATFRVTDEQGRCARACTMRVRGLLCLFLAVVSAAGPAAAFLSPIATSALPVRAGATRTAGTTRMCERSGPPAASFLIELSQN